ncbi:hypothetical protein L209DRAFT_153342 [Thermothelomyces heterothallicus CBS 203.75]
MTSQAAPNRGEGGRKREQLPANRQSQGLHNGWGKKRSSVNDPPPMSLFFSQPPVPILALSIFFFTPLPFVISSSLSLLMLCLFVLF